MQLIKAERGCSVRLRYSPADGQWRERKGSASHADRHRAGYSHIIAHPGRCHGDWWPAADTRGVRLCQDDETPCGPLGPAPRPKQGTKRDANFNFINLKLMKYEDTRG